MKIIEKYSCCWLLLAGIFGLCSCEPTSASIENEAEVKIATTKRTTTTVTSGMVENRNFEYIIQCNGRIKPLREQFIICETAGKLLVCIAQTGKRISSGSVIMQVETTPIQYRLQKVKLAQFNCQKEYESQLLAYESLLKDKTKDQADDIRQKLKISTGLAGAEQDIIEANYELSKAVIKAPFSGVLADVKVQQGQLVKSGEELLRIYDPENLLLEVKVLEADISMLKTGISAEVSPISNPELKYNAAVYEINPYVDENGMVTVKLKIGNKQRATGNKTIRSLFPGMSCTTTIKVPFAKTLVVPKEAVVMRSGKAVVFTLEEGKAKWNYVTTGKENGNEIEIKEGLKQGQKVITNNNLQLVHDASVIEIDKTENN